MIITLTGANFSSNNIGTLNTWRIVRNLLGVTTSSNISSVEKGTSYSATFTIQTGYEYLAGGYSVIMGGTDVTSTVLTWNDTNTIATIAIDEVIGNVQINITAQLSDIIITQLDKPTINIVEVT